MRLRLAIVALSLFATQACAGALGQLGSLIQPPRFEQVPDRPAELRLAGISGATIRLWTNVSNPNPFGLRLGTLSGTLFLDDTRAADVDFPLGLPLAAMGDSVIPIDISISFSELPGLGNVARRVVNRQAIGYRLDGTIGVDAGQLGQPVFGPLTLIRGETAIR